MSWFFGTVDLSPVYAAIAALSQQLKQTEHRLMAKIDTFFTALEEHFDKQEAVHNAIAGDITYLKEQVQAFIDAQGDLSGDQLARAQAILARATSIEGQFEALDAMTPPKPPSP